MISMDEFSDLIMSVRINSQKLEKEAQKCEESLKKLSKEVKGLTHSVEELESLLFAYRNSKF